MTITTNSQAPFVCNTITERDFISANYPIPEMTSCTIRLTPTSTEVYRWESVSGVFSWVRTYPDQATIDWLTQNSIDIVTLQSQMSGKANTSSLATVATSGSYNDLSSKPTIPSATVDYYALTTKPAAKSFNNSPTPTIQTVAAAANGDRLSTFRDAYISYSVSIDTSVSLAGNSSGYVVLEIAATNSTTASDWKEINRVSSGQSGALVVGLTLNQTGGGSLTGVLPAGWFRRVRKVNVAGTPTITLTGSQEVLAEPLQVSS